MTATKAMNFIGKAERLSPGRAGLAAATCSSLSAGEGAVTALGGRASVRLARQWVGTLAESEGVVAEKVNACAAAAGANRCADFIDIEPPNFTRV